VGEKFEEYIQRVQEEGLKARATEEQVLNTIMGGLLSYIQASVSNHDIEAGAAGLASIKKWSAVAESFLPTVFAGADNARLTRQIEDLSAKLESTQMRLVDSGTSRKTVPFDGDEVAEANTPSSRMASLNRSEGGLKGVVVDQGLRHPRIPEGTNGSVPDRAVHRVRNQGAGSRAGNRGNNRGTLRVQDIINRRHRAAGSTLKKGKNLMMVHGEPSTEEVRREGGCNPHFIREDRGFQGGNKFDGQTPNTGQNSRQNSGQNSGRNSGYFNCNNPTRCE